MTQKQYSAKVNYENLIRMSLVQPDSVNNFKAINAYYHYWNIINGTALIDKNSAQKQFLYLKKCLFKTVSRILKMRSSKDVRIELQMLNEDLAGVASLGQIDGIVSAALDLIANNRQNQ
ncbi:hypothetical protein [Niabella soli]|uniref:Uncharacterized protein n=1 Tax=Niabella soli DSM 19437 TaxID=929713 RepID=W0F2U9_9BACT|nr:hypothetical protein [Niabella soli]AHF17342.1 hypothetical protein NIASO_05885 [Niabella soli DSM 19437]